MEAIYKVVERRVEEAKTIEEVERVRSQASLQQADRRFASIPKPLDVEDVVKQVTAPHAADEPVLSPSEIPIQRFCELLDAVDLPSHALESVQRLVEKEKTEHTAPGGVFQRMPKKDLLRRSEIKLAQLIERVSPVVQNMEERIPRFFLLTRSQEDTKALLLTLAILRRQHELLDDTDPKFIVDVEEVNSMLARMAGWANKGISAASFHSRVLENMGKAGGASQTSKE
ncbi:hypothetical protein FB107DRAFT_198597 [Schizophyllum commune]